jgi:hypothetical protein
MRPFVTGQECFALNAQRSYSYYILVRVLWKCN